MSRRWVPRAIGLPLLLLMGAVYPAGAPANRRRLRGAARAGGPSAEQALLNRYCASCHNEKTKQGNFVLSTLDVDNVGPDAERWELVVRKLRARSMPPMGRPRPAEADYDRARLAPRDVARSRGGRESRSGTHRHVPPLESHRISERDPRSARSRDRCRRDAAERRLEPRVRQHQRRRTLADAPRALSVGRAENQPPRGGHARALRRRRDGRPSARSHAGRSLRRPAVRHARGHERAVHVSGRRRIPVRAAADARSQRAHRRAHRASSGRGERRRRARAGLHAEARAANRPGRSGRAAIRAGAGGRCAPQLPDARNRRSSCRAGGVHQAALGARRNRAAAVSGQLQQRSDAENAAGALQRLDCRTVQPDAASARRRAGNASSPAGRSESGGQGPGSKKQGLREDDSLHARAPRVSAARRRAKKCRRCLASTSRGGPTAASSTASRWRFARC